MKGTAEFSFRVTASRPPRDRSSPAVSGSPQGPRAVIKSLTESQLVNAIAEMPKHSVAMLYGAGASRSSGVLLASEIVHDLCLSGYCQEFGITDPAARERVTRHDV